MPSGVTTDTKKDLVPGVGVLTFKKAASRYALVTQGPPAIKPLAGMRNLASDIDGVTADIAGFDVKDDNNVEITLTAVNLSIDVLKTMYPGATVTSAGTPAVTTITPLAASTLFPTTSYLEDVEVTFPKGIDGLEVMVVPKALVVDWNFTSPNKAKGQVALTIRARLDMDAVGATTDDPTHHWEITEPTA